jgi:hypothetical protein
MVILLLSAVVAACASTAVPTATPTGSPVIATPALTIEPTGTPEPTLASVPAELLGTWQADFGGGDVAILRIKERAYAITREGSATGRLEPDDGALLFSHSDLCTGEGRYAWTLEGDALHLESIGTDACPGRQKSLDGVTYVPVAN